MFLWSAAPGAPGTTWAPLRLSPGENSAFVRRLQDYGGLQVQRFLDIDCARVAHSVTKDIFPQEGRVGALHSRQWPISPIGYGQARDHFSSGTEGCPRAEGWRHSGQRRQITSSRRFPSGRARAGTTPSTYKAIDNGLWYLLGQFAEPPPGTHAYPCFPPDTDQGRNRTGNVYEAFVGLYWL